MSESIKKAVESYITRHTPKKIDKKNRAPEKEVERICLAYMRENGFDVNVAESKSTYSPTQKKYIAQALMPGMSDIFGNDEDGHAVFVELKAPGRRNTIRTAQWDFLNRKIQSNAFAVCVDSPQLLHSYYNEWFRLRKESGLERARTFLLNILPKKPIARGESSDGPLFDE